MPELDKNLFAGSADIDSDEARGAEVQNLGNDVSRKLSSSGWNGIEGVGCIGLVLSADNERVERGTLIVKGQLEEEPVRIEANKIWADADENAVLSLKLDKGEIFYSGWAHLRHPASGEHPPRTVPREGRKSAATRARRRV